jgi:AcrR family transcriptional regulator
MECPPSAIGCQPLTERKSPIPRRTYEMRERADHVAATRRRIVEAAAYLHGTIGPAATTISAIAARAKVTRLTVYRHFPDDVAIFAACSQHWASGHVMPDPDAWQQIADPEERLRAGLTDLYRFYRDAEAMLSNVRRDADALPISLRERNAAEDVRRRDALLRAFPAARGNQHTRLRAVIGHATSFTTWQSLCGNQRLPDREAVDVMTGLVLAVASPMSPAAFTRPVQTPAPAVDVARRHLRQHTNAARRVADN